MFDKTIEVMTSGAVIVQILKDGEVIASNAFSCARDNITQRITKAETWGFRIIRSMEFRNENN